MNLSTSTQTIFSKVNGKIQTIRQYLMSLAFSKEEISLFFMRKIFKNDIEKIHDNDFIKQGVKKHIKTSLSKGIALDQTLTGILERLEIEQKIIEELEKQQQKEVKSVFKKIQNYQCKQTITQTKNLSSLKLKTNCSIKERCDQFEKSYNNFGELSLIKSFQKELNESLEKTRLLKKLIQQKLYQDSDENRLYKYNYSNDLPLETSF